MLASAALHANMTQDITLLLPPVLQQHSLKVVQIAVANAYFGASAYRRHRHVKDNIRVSRSCACFTIKSFTKFHFMRQLLKLCSEDPLICG